MVQSLLDRVEKIIGKGANAGYQNFLLFQQCFQKIVFPRSLNMGLFGEGTCKTCDCVVMNQS